MKFFILAILTLSLNVTAVEAAVSKTILALGDSITAGAPDHKSPAEFPPSGRGNPQSQYSYWIEQKHPEWRFINRGVSGERTSHILNRLERELELAAPDVVILMAGVNDIYGGLPQDVILRNLDQLYSRIQARGLPLMVLTVLPYNGITAQKFAVLEAVNAWIEKTAAERNLGFCDTFQAMHAPGDPTRLALTRDGLHPNPQGYQVMGNTVNDALESWKPVKA